MPSNTPSNTHESETMHTIPFVEHEYILWKVSRRKNQIVGTLAVTIALLVGALAYILLKI